MSVDSDREGVYASGAHAFPSLRAAAGTQGLTAPTPRRRPPSQQEQERRIEWGKWWGAETKRVYDELLGRME